MIARSTAEVETLKGALAQANEQARESKAAAGKAPADLKTEQVAHRQHEERVAEVEQELKDAIGKCKAWRRRIRPKRLNSPKPSNRPRRHEPSLRQLGRRSGRTNKSRLVSHFFCRVYLAVKDMPCLLDYGVLHTPLRIFRRVLLTPRSSSGPRRGTRWRSCSGHNTWRRSIRRC